MSVWYLGYTDYFLENTVRKKRIKAYKKENVV